MFYCPPVTTGKPSNIKYNQTEIQPNEHQTTPRAAVLSACEGSVCAWRQCVGRARCGGGAHGDELVGVVHHGDEHVEQHHQGDDVVRPEHGGTHELGELVARLHVGHVEVQQAEDGPEQGLKGLKQP